MLISSSKELTKTWGTPKTTPRFLEIWKLEDLIWEACSGGTPHTERSTGNFYVTQMLFHTYIWLLAKVTDSTTHLLLSRRRKAVRAFHSTEGLLTHKESWPLICFTFARITKSTTRWQLPPSFWQIRARATAGSVSSADLIKLILRQRTISWMVKMKNFWGITSSSLFARLET